QLLDALKRAGQRATDGATVLLVDDDKQDLKLFQNALKQKGYVTIARSNAVAALRAATEQPPDIIVLDLVMPRMGLNSSAASGPPSMAATPRSSC
ncbi:MAG TPA: response regulator, partial [Candidatus Binataceae bacterium]|nr:response regulator [Candidatus Binataceae bacterium]